MCFGRRSWQFCGSLNWDAESRNCQNRQQQYIANNWLIMENSNISEQGIILGEISGNSDEISLSLIIYQF